MASISPSAMLVAALLAMPLTSALAQSNNPAGNYGSNRSSTASPVTGDTPGSGMSTADVGAPHKTVRHRHRLVS